MSEGKEKEGEEREREREREKEREREREREREGGGQQTRLTRHLRQVWHSLCKLGVPLAHAVVQLLQLHLESREAAENAAK